MPQQSSLPPPAPIQQVPGSSNYDQMDRGVQGRSNQAHRGRERQQQAQECVNHVSLQDAQDHSDLIMSMLNIFGHFDREY